MHYIYIIECSDNTLYTGYTNNIDKRINAHNSGNGGKYTRGRTPVKLVYKEEFQDKIEALKREWAVKKLSRQKKLDLIEDYEEK